MRFHEIGILVIALIVIGVDAFTFHAYCSHHIGSEPRKFSDRCRDNNGIRTSLKLLASVDDRNKQNKNLKIIDARNKLNDEFATLQEDVYKTDKKASSHEKQIKTLQNKIKKISRTERKENKKLQENEKIWSAEKTELFNRISDFTRMLQELEVQSKNETDALKMESKRREELMEKKILQLRSSMDTVEGRADEEKEATAVIQGRLSKAQAQLRMDKAVWGKETQSLKNMLAREQNKFQSLQNQTNDAQIKIRENDYKFQQVQSEIESQQVEFENDKQRLEETIENDVRVRKLKERQMEDRYGIIKKDLTSYLESTKDNAEKERKRIKVKLSQRDDIVSQLQSELQNVTLEAEQLQQLIDDMEQEAKRIKLEKLRIRFDPSLEDRDELISALQQNITALTNEKNKLLEETTDIEKQLQRETSRAKTLQKQLESNLSLYLKEFNTLNETIFEQKRELELHTLKMTNRTTLLQNEMPKKIQSKKLEYQNSLEELKQMQKLDLKRKNNKINDLVKEKMQITQKYDRVDDLVDSTTEILEGIRSLDLLLAERNKEELGLNLTIKGLQLDLKERDRELERMETRYREIFKLVARLTKKRLRESKLGKLVRSRGRRNQG